jgi:hypothetical protein
LLKTQPEMKFSRSSEQFNLSQMISSETSSTISGGGRTLLDHSLYSSWCNQHSTNAKLVLGDLWKGIQGMPNELR